MKKAYFYTLDVVIGLVIVVLGLILLADLYFFAPEKVKTETIAQDVMEVLSAVTIEDVCQDLSICDCNYDALARLCRDNQIKNPRISILELFGQLYFDRRQGVIDDLVNEILIGPGIIPFNHELQIILYDPADMGSPQQIYPAVT